MYAYLPLLRSGEFFGLAPFRILSVDIECAGRKVGAHTSALQLAG